MDGHSIRVDLLEDDLEDEPELDECPGHPAGPFDPMGETVFCDGSCRSV